MGFPVGLKVDAPVPALDTIYRNSLLQAFNTTVSGVTINHTNKLYRTPLANTDIQSKDPFTATPDFQTCCRFTNSLHGPVTSLACLLHQLVVHAVLQPGHSVLLVI